MKMDVYDIRLKNARSLARGMKLAEFAAMIDRAPTQVSRFMGKNPTKPIGPKIARDIEERCGKARGWLDVVHHELEISEQLSAADITKDLQIREASELLAEIPDRDKLLLIEEWSESLPIEDAAKIAAIFSARISHDLGESEE